MARSCESCNSPNRRELDRRIRSGATLPDVQRWLASLDEPRSINALTRHRQHTLPEKVPSGPRPKSRSFLEDVEAVAHDDLAAGVLRPSIRDAISARAELNRTTERSLDRDVLLQIAMAMTGQVAPQIAQATVIDPDEQEWRDRTEANRLALEAEFRPLSLGEGTPGADYLPKLDDPRQGR